MTAPRLRFAPAPTGYLHVGSARTALFNWLYAQQTNGQLFLRIEDTNAALNQPGLYENIIESLDWLGITFEGDPIFQSQRTDLYNDAINGWLANGLAYEKDGAVWFTMPADGRTSFDDVIRGRVEFDNTNLKDFVVRRSDGSPTYVVANSVDDLDLDITHIIRGEDMLNITPQGLALRHALGATEQPVYAHLPLIVNEQKKKLSKRRDDVAVRDFRSQGILAQAMRNYLVLLGWGPSDNIEVRPIDEVVDLFRLENVGASSAVFDMAKLTAINATYIRALSPDEFAEAIEPWVRQTDWANSWLTRQNNQDLSERLGELAPLIQERTKLLADAPDQIAFFFIGTESTVTDSDAPTQATPSETQTALSIDEAAWKKATTDTEQAKTILAKAIDLYDKADWSQPANEFATQAHQQLRQIADDLEIKLRLVQLPVRVALTGSNVGPPLFESMYLLGHTTTLERLRTALARL